MDLATIANLVVRIGADISNFEQSMNRIQRATRQIGDGMQRAGRSLTAGLTLPIAALGGTTAKLAIDFESAFAGVRKTVDATEKEFAVLRKGIRDMAKEIPATAVEIAGVAEVAGQLGIEKKHLLSFTRTMVDLGVATNMSSEEAATALARLANITQMPQKNFDRLGSTVVALGNNLATTEGEIVEMSLRLAGAGHQVGLTESQILGFAGTLSSLGIHAEAGGSAFSRAFIIMSGAVNKGGKELDLFAKVAGSTVDDFRKKFQEDAAGAMIDFVEGLGKMKDSGEDVFSTLKDLGMSEILLRDALLRAAGAGDLLRKSVQLGNEAWKENKALTEEAEERYKTTESQLIILKNKLADVGITIGDALLPAINKMIDYAQPFIVFLEKAADKFKNLDPKIQVVIIAFAGLLAGIGPLLVIVGMLISAISTVGAAIGAVGAGPILIAIGAIASLVAIGVALWKNWETIKAKAIPIFEGVKQAIAPLAESMKGSFQTFMESVGPIWESLKRLFESLKPVLVAIAAVIGGVLVISFGNFISMVSAIIAALGPLINALINVVEVVVNVVMAIVSAMTGDFDAAWDYLKNAGQAFLDFFGNLVGAIKNFVVTLVSSIIDYFSGLYDTLVGNSIIPDMVNAIIKWFERMKSFLTSIVSSIKTVIVAIWSSIKAVTSTVWNGIKSLFSSVWNGIKSVVTSAVNGIRTTITSAWNGVKTITNTIWNGVKTTISKGISGALNVVKNYASQFLSAGKGLLDALTKGIQQGVSKAVGAVRDGMSKIRSYLPFSPAKEGPLKDLDKSGESFFPTWGGGVAKGFRPMKNQMEKMMGDIMGRTIAGSAGLAAQTAMTNINAASSGRMGYGLSSLTAGTAEGAEPRVVAPEYVVVKIGAHEIVRAIAPEMGREQYRIARERSRAVGREKI